MQRLTHDDHRQIREAATAVEARTDAKITIVITRVSDRYSLYSLAGAALGAFTAGGFAIAARPAISGRSLIVVELLVLVVLALLLDIMPIRLALVPIRVKQASARGLAHREFATQVMTDGAHQMRILLFLSIGERYVEIIADHATHARAPEGTWNKIVDDLIAAIKSERIADGIIAAIASCDATLPARSAESEADADT